MFALALLLAPPADARSAVPDARAALAALNPLVGQWRGVAQPRRGSAAGAWRENGEWVWDFADPARPALVFTVAGGERPRTLRFDPASADFAATETGAVTADGDGCVTVRVLNADRFTLLRERRRTPAGRFRRAYEVGYTREGVRLAERGVGGPECVVTGGLGTIAVSHAGTTYHVCCTGCVAAFEADPEGVLKAYRERKAGR